MKAVPDEQFDEEHSVLRNILGFTDPVELTAAVATLSYVRVAELETKPLPGKLGSTHLRAIHRYIFQDVFPWAGEFRTVMTARSDSFGFPPPKYIAPSLDDLFSQVHQRERPERPRP